ncbi:hypothetical protein ACLMJK_001988 [Lecanora helva]
MKTFSLDVAAPLLIAILGSVVNASPAPAYPGCEAANNAAAIGDETALRNAIAACSAAGNAGEQGSGSGSGAGGAPKPAPVAPTPAQGDGCYECGPASEYYKPGCHCENTLYVSK